MGKVTGFHVAFCYLTSLTEVKSPSHPGKMGIFVVVKPVNHSLITHEMGMKHIVEEKYMIDELDTGDEYDRCNDRPNIFSFNEEYEITKDFNFKVGMEFSSLKQFKTDIL